MTARSRHGLSLRTFIIQARPSATSHPSVPRSSCLSVAGNGVEFAEIDLRIDSPEAVATDIG